MEVRADAGHGLKLARAVLRPRPSVHATVPPAKIAMPQHPLNKRHAEAEQGRRGPRQVRERRLASADRCPHLEESVRARRVSLPQLFLGCRQVRVDPVYPPRLEARGIEGSVHVQFNVTAAGTVRDAIVVASEPRGTFDAAALEAIARWRYNPRIVNGTAVERVGLQTLVRFELEDRAGSGD